MSLSVIGSRNQVNTFIACGSHDPQNFDGKQVPQRRLNENPKLFHFLFVLPHSVTGSTEDFGSFSLGSNPGGAAGARRRSSPGYDRIESGVRGGENCVSWP